MGQGSNPRPAAGFAGPLRGGVDRALWLWEGALRSRGLAPVPGLG